MKRGEAAPKGSPRTQLPFRAVDRPDAGLDRMGSEDDDHVVHRTRAHALEHRLEQDPLLRRAEPRRGAGSEDDRCDHRELARGDGHAADDHRLRGLLRLRIAELTDALDHVEALNDLAQHGVLGR
jgi:hypothetical protein